jgi:hypothetical protein
LTAVKARVGRCAKIFRTAWLSPAWFLEAGWLMYLTEDPELIVDAVAYVYELHTELAAENSAPPLGVQNQVVDAILADPALSAYVREWARRNRVLEASASPPQRPPIDDTYRRVRAMLTAEREAAST